MGMFRGTLKLSQVVSIFSPFEAYPQVHVSCGGLSSSRATYHISNSPMYAYRHGGRDGSRLDERGTKGQKRQRARGWRPAPGLAFWCEHEPVQLIRPTPCGPDEAACSRARLVPFLSNFFCLWSGAHGDGHRAEDPGRLCGTREQARTLLLDPDAPVSRRQ
jgi:hypothetical protein